jgi:hypothetical protein
VKRTVRALDLAMQMFMWATILGLFIISPFLYAIGV